MTKNICLAIGLIALVVMTYKVGFTQILGYVMQMGYWMIAVLAVWAVAYALNTLSTLLIIRDGSELSKNIKFLSLYKITISTFAINAATPIGLAGGEPYKVLELKKYIGVEKATSSVILFTMMHVSAHLLFWLSSILIIPMSVPLQEGWSVALIATFLVCVFLLFLLVRGYKKGLVLNVMSVLARLPFMRRRISAMIRSNKERIEIIDSQISSLHGKRKLRFYLALSIEFFTRVFTCIEIYIMFIAVGQEASFADCIIIMSLTSLFANILFFSPMQLGTREGGFLLSFTSLGFSSAHAISVSFITRARELVWMFIGLVLMKVELKDGSKKII